MATAPEHQGTLDTKLQRVLGLVDVSRLGAAVGADVRAGAERSARALFAACGADDQAVGLVVLGFTAELLAAVVVDLAADPREASRLIERLEAEIGAPRAPLLRELLRGGRLLELPVEIAIEVALSLLRAFAGADTVSLWMPASEGELELVSHAGEPSARVRDAARAVLERPAAGARDPDIIALRIEALRPPRAALVAGGVRSVDAGGATLLTGAGPLLAVLLDRRALLETQDAPDRVVGAVERRLARLRFDLHDGPQQDIHLLAQDLRLFRDQLRPMIAGDPNQERALGRLDDLEAQLVALDGDLRRLATTVQSPFLAPASLPDALRQLTDAFTARTGVIPATRLQGAVTTLTDSQQIALLSLIREALTNIRQHSGAAAVEIAISADSDGVQVRIRDDGSGFDPEITLVRAPRAGRLGLVGMHERVRMLGGSTTIDSRPGGPTMISATLPPWSAE